MPNTPTEGDDSLVGGSGPDEIHALGGNDTVLGMGGSDTLYGDSGNDYLDGGSGNDTIDGGEGDDTLSGGGPEADRLIGGIGNDVFLITSAGDIIKENAEEGTDTVISTIAYQLAPNVENLVLTGTADINGRGNELNNWITGNAGKNGLFGEAGNDTLDGGLGADTMDGGAGNDLIFVNESGDVAKEHFNEGNDTVVSAVSYSLGDYLENLTLTGTGALNGTGNGEANRITGNSGSNVLTGNAGNDSLNGGGSADTLSGGSGADSLLGGTGADVLDGGSGDDTLRGGIGHDTVTGGTGNDVFIFEDLASSPIDTITDFGLDEDILLFSRGANNFDAAKWVNGVLAASDFETIDTAAAPSSTDGHHFIYDTTSGALWYDDDGAGEGSAVKVAVINPSSGLAADDLHGYL